MTIEAIVTDATTKMDLWQLFFLAILAGGVALAVKAAFFERDKPRPTSVQMSLLEFRTSERQVEPRGTFDEGCYRAMLREVAKKRIVR